MSTRGSYGQQVPDLTRRSNGSQGIVPSRQSATNLVRERHEFTRLQLIDDEQNFSEELPNYMQNKWGLEDSGFNYDVVAVFGSQSTGKSTLLNRLFGTRFDVMNEGQRKQTTRGIWADRGTDGMPILILDVEGTDGRERGENQDFERKSALFSLAISEVLIVNMWETMVGLYNGANMGLLKTVMEVNLQLFGGNRNSKTLLYFVIRDHVSSTPLSSLADTLNIDLQRIWDGLSRPDGLENAQLSDYFDVRFTSLSHKMLQPENFERQALDLRRQFTDKKSDDYVFQPAYKRRVPADGFPRYAQAVWEKVVSNKDLDLPTQQELLAQYRCDEIAAMAIGPFREAVELLRPRVQRGQIVDELGDVSRKARTQAIGAFDEQAARYHSEVYQKKRAAFVQTLDSELHAMFLNQVKNALTLAAETFSSQGFRALEEGANEGRGFNETVGAVRVHMEEQFIATVRALAVPGVSWSFETEIEQLEAQLEAIMAKLRKAEMERVLERLRRDARDAVTESVAEHLGNPDDGMWAGVMAGFDAACVQADSQLIKRMDAAGVEPQARSALGRKLHQLLWDDTADVLREEVADQMVLLKLRTALEDRFRYDAAGLPRVWRPTDDIDAEFATARSAAQALLPKFSKVDISGSIKLRRPADFFPAGYDFARTLVLISPARAREVGKRFGREADALYLEAKRAMVTTQNQVPMWVIALLVMLGWNEAMTVLFNPIYLILVCLIGGAAFVVHNLGMWGPLLRTVNGLAGMANDHVHHLLVEAVNRTEPGRPGAKASTVGSGSDNLLARKSSSVRISENIELEPLGEGNMAPSSAGLTDTDNSSRYVSRSNSGFISS
ncbi:root hair defective 3 GTP-binding protein [Kickxella alabastrina]|uniref:root hair defective 3 GTP-binding protein n=1 Tax=Kickxella alabastrina TaxID=61397 RepID=UPI00221E58C2|nr:root hair defective 3 GTP-binding protein [Kickxella alabastrina]KAI7827928.1 root hair defective 3 GTP-binding protein [Kickxella alabastrina]